MGGGTRRAGGAVPSVSLALAPGGHRRRLAGDGVANPACRPPRTVGQRVSRLRRDRARRLCLLVDVARRLPSAALLGAVYLLTRELFRPQLLRRWAFVLCVLGGGIGAFLPRDVHLGPLTTHATEMSSPGSSVADLISMAPHLPWALALLCWTMVVALRLRHRGDRLLVASGLLSILGLQLIYPQLALLAVAA